MIVAVVNKSDNEIAANVIDDMRNNKIELWQTEEGKRRLQLMYLKGFVVQKEV